MEITYLKNLEFNPELVKGHPMRGWDEDQILDLELKYNKGNSFPKAFREYLYLAGDYGGTGVINENWDQLREDCKEDMKDFGVELDREFFIIDELDSMYSIFFLDKNEEDPTIYIFNAAREENDIEPLLKASLIGTFSQLINEAIRRRKNNIPL
jgi:hypothetical protein